MNLLLGVGFSGGLITIPILFLIAAIVSFYKYNKTKSLIPLWLGIGSIAAIVISIIVMATAT